MHIAPTILSKSDTNISDTMISPRRMFSSTASPYCILLLFTTFSLFASLSPSMSVQAQSTSPAKTPAPSTTTNKPTSTPTSSSTLSSSPETSTSTSPKAVQTHKIQVGLADHKFKPDSVNAVVGDIIEFSFFPQNHSVVRAEYQYPCIPYEMTGPNKQGFYSGFHYMDAVPENPPTYRLLINDTTPQFFYCSAPGSCTTYGMVGVINPNSTTPLETQRNLALSADYALSPGEPFPAESPSTSHSSIPSASPPRSSSKISTGAIVGIVIACVGVVVLGGLLVFFWGRFRGLRDEMKRKDSTIVRTSSPHTPRMGFWPGGPSPSYTQTPMSSHAKPGLGSLPPAYFPSSSPTPASAFHYPAGTAMTTNDFVSSEGGVSRSTSHRSTGGTFDVSPKGYYTRTHEGSDTYKLAHTSDMTSPTDPSIIPVGPYGRRMQDLQRLAVTDARPPDSSRLAERGYFETDGGRSVTRHINQEYGPVEMDDTSVKPGNFI